MRRQMSYVRGKREASQELRIYGITESRREQQSCGGTELRKYGGAEHAAWQRRYGIMDLRSYGGARHGGRVAQELRSHGFKDLWIKRLVG